MRLPIESEQVLREKTYAIPCAASHPLHQAH